MTHLSEKLFWRLTNKKVEEWNYAYANGISLVWRREWYDFPFRYPTDSGVTSIVWALHDKQPGEVWEKEEIRKVQKQLEPYGFNMDVVESVNVHDDIKIGLPTRDKYIANYIQTIRNPGMNLA